MSRNFNKYLILFLLTLIAICCRNREGAGSHSESISRITDIEAKQVENRQKFIYDRGAVVRGDTTIKEIALVFTGDEFGDGGKYISETLEKENIKASFFLTGNFYRKKEFEPIIRELLRNGNYLGSHSDKHLLYCDWIKRDSLLVGKKEFINDLDNSYSEMVKFGIKEAETRYFLPPYEWYNDSIASWTAESGLQLVNFTGSTRSNADYTYPGMGKQYVDSETIYNSVVSFEQHSASGMKGFILLLHIGTDPERTDKFYFYLPELVKELKNRGYRFIRIDELLD